jgi:O-antigen/teichoic acid export membrane protein
MNLIPLVRERLSRLSGRSRAVGMFFATSLAARGLGIICQLLQVPVAVRFLGPEAFGLWMALTSISFVITFADFGVGQGAQNKLAEAFAAGRLDEARDLWGSTLTFLGVVGAGLAAAVLLVAPRLDYTGLFHLVDPGARAQAGAAVTVMLCLFCLNFPLGLAQRLAYSRQQGWMHNLAQGAAAVGALAGVVLAAHLRWGLAGIIVAAQAPLLLANAGLLGLLLAQLGWLNLRSMRGRRSTMRQLLGLGAYFGVQQMLLTLMISLPPIMISTCLGAAAVTPYNLTQRLFNFFAIIQNAFMLPLWPAYSDAKARGEFGWIRRTLFFSLRATIFCTILPMTLGALLAPRLIALWVGANAPLPSPALIWALFLWNAATFLQQPFGYLLAGLSEVRRLTFYAGVSALASGALMEFAVRRYGPAGAVVGLLAGYLPFLIIGNIAETIRVLRRHPDRTPACPPLVEPVALETNP